MPQSPAHLRGLSKREKQNDPEYEIFIKALREYEKWQTLVRENNGNHYRAYNAIWQKWNEQFVASKQEFIAQNRDPLIADIFPAQYRDKLMKFVSDGYDCRYSYDELEVL